MATLQRALATAPLLQRSTAADTGVFSIGYDEEGVLTPVRWSHPRSTRDEDTQMQTLIAQHTQQRHFATGIIVRSDSVRVLSWQASYSCAPALLDRAQIVRAMEQIGRDRELQGRRAVVQILVGNDGRALDVRLDRSTGSVAADQELAALFRSARFLPGRFEARPIPTWAEIPLEFGATRRR